MEGSKLSGKIKILLMIVGVVLAILTSISSFWLPKAKPEDAPDKEFSAIRAMKHVEKVAAETHHMGTPENEKVRDYIIGVLSDLGLNVETQKTYSSNLIWGEMRSGEIENIYSILEGSGKDKDSILMMAHYDSTYGGPGAADDASGVASLLEIIRILKISKPLENDVIFLFTDGEEEGMLGATAFVKDIPLVKDIDLVINLESRGNSGPSIMFETTDDNGWFMQEFKKSSVKPLAYSFSYEIYKRMNNDTDFTKFKEIGKSGFNFANIAGFYAYHQQEDSVANLNRDTLQQIGENALGLVEHFGNLDLKNRQSNNAVYFTVTKSFLIMYSENLAIPLAAFALVLFIATLCVGWKKKYISTKGSLLGAAITLILVGVSFVIGVIGKSIVKVINSPPNDENWFTASFVKNLTATGITCLIVAIVAILLILCMCYWKLQKIVSIYNMINGSLFIWLVLTLVSSIMFRSASYIFVWPTITLLMGLVIIPLLSKQSSRDIVAVSTFTLITFICVIIFLPICYLLYLSMVMPNMFILSVLTVVATLPLMLVVQMGIILLRNESSVSQLDKN